MPLLQGQVLEQRYRIETLLGQGGMGAVYRATDLRFNTSVAIKENLTVTPDAQRQFGREAALLHQMRHPNLPRVTDHFSVPGQGQYLVMDYVEGEDLKQLLNRRGPLAEDQALAWIQQVLDALTYLHRCNIIHRDVKPANVKITPQGQVFLVDFGLAKVYEPSQETTIGARGATPGYAPPEQYGQGRTDARSDVYSAGATLYAMLAGQPPADALLLTLQQVELIPLSALNPVISPWVEAAVAKAMQIRPADRHQTAAELRGALLEPPTRRVGAAGYQPAAEVPSTAPAEHPVATRPKEARPSPDTERRRRIATLLAQAWAAFERQDWGGTEALCKQILALDAQHREAQDLLQKARTARQLDDHYDRAQRAMQARDWGRAVAGLEQVVALDASYRDAQTLLKQAKAEQEQQRRPAPSPPAGPQPQGLRPQSLRLRIQAQLAKQFRPPAPGRSRLPLVLTLAALGLFVAIAVGLYALLSGPAGGFPANTEEGNQATAALKSEGPSAAAAGEGILFTSNREGKREIYRLRGGQTERLTQTPGDAESWAPVATESGILFTSNRDGKPEIYRLHAGQTERLTQTPGNGESWGPVPSETGILFTSNRSGRPEVYRLHGGQVEQITQTPGGGGSWSPYPTRTGILFTSNRDGKREIYRLHAGQTDRLTHTPGDGESWAAIEMDTGILFTSDRVGKREIYRLHGGQVEQLTQTPGEGASWLPAPTETGILFNSDRGGNGEIYRLHSGQVEQVTHTSGGESWLGDEAP